MRCSAFTRIVNTHECLKTKPNHHLHLLLTSPNSNDLELSQTDRTDTIHHYTFMYIGIIRKNFVNFYYDFIGFCLLMFALIQFSLKAEFNAVLLTE